MFGIPKNKSTSKAAAQPTAEPGLGLNEVAEPNPQLDPSPELVHIEVTPDQVKEQLEKMSQLFAPIHIASPVESMAAGMVASLTGIHVPGWTDKGVDYQELLKDLVGSDKISVAEQVQILADAQKALNEKMGVQLFHLDDAVYEIYFGRPVTADKGVVVTLSEDQSVKTSETLDKKLKVMFETTPQSNDTTTATAWLSGLETGQTIDSDVLQTMLLGSMARVVQETPYTPEGHFTLTYREDDGVDTYQFSTMSELSRPFDELETLGFLCSKIRSQFELIDIHPTERWLEALTSSAVDIKDYLFNHPETVGHMVTTIEIAPGPKRNNIDGATLKVSMVIDEGDIGAHLVHLSRL